MHDDRPDAASSPSRDGERLADLYRLDVLDSPPGEQFERIARVAAQALDVPIALVTVIDHDQQQFIASIGIDLEPIARHESFCTHAIARPGSVMVVPDARLDARFVDNPLVVGAPHIRFYAGTPICPPDGEPIGTLCVLDTEPRQFDERDLLRDLGSIIERELMHMSMSMTDSLTGLANRRAFISSAQRFLTLGRRRSDPISVIFADVNGLKLVNDEFGHADGDSLLRRAAATITAVTRSSDVVARVGGDEFAVLLYDADADEAARVMAAIHVRAEADNADLDPAQHLSIALGASTATADDSVADLVARADAAMFDAKQAGDHRSNSTPDDRTGR